SRNFSPAPCPSAALSPAFHPCQRAPLSPPPPPPPLRPSNHRAGHVGSTGRDERNFRHYTTQGCDVQRNDSDPPHPSSLSLHGEGNMVGHFRALSYPGGHSIFRPPRRWKWRWATA